MRRPRHLSLAVLCALPLALSSASAAHADAFADVFKAYRTSGTIDPCKFTAAQLSKAKSQIPNDYEQYAPDFKDAIDAAAKARAGGACKEKPTKAADTGAGAPATGGTPSSGTPAPGSAPAPTPTPSGTTPAPAPTTATPGGATPAPTPQPAASVKPAAVVTDDAILAAASATDDNGADLPAPLLALAAVALLAALAAAFVALARWWAVDPVWMQRSRHATAEAGWRTSAAWAEFTDWLRLGR